MQQSARTLALSFFLAIGAVLGFSTSAALPCSAFEVVGGEAEEIAANVRPGRSELRMRRHVTRVRPTAPTPARASALVPLDGPFTLVVDVGPRFGRSLLHRHRRLLI